MIRFKLGMWLWTSSLKLARFGRDVALKYDSQGLFEKATSSTFVIHRLIEGPFTQQDLGYEWGGPEDAECYLVVLLETDSSTEEVEWYFETVEEAYTWVKHFKCSIEPITIRGETYG